MAIRSADLRWDGAVGPATYWRLWSDAIVHRIHLRVLRHIKQLAETDVSR